jgi:glutamine amidotransferase
MIVIIDYGAGNLRSLFSKVQEIDSNVMLTSNPKDVERADKILLPGVGFFASAIENLRKYDFVPVLNKKVIEEKTPFLGICLGMQLLTKRSEEGNAKGLGWIDAETKKFKFSENNSLKIPHMGWNNLIVKKQSPLLQDVPEDFLFYFTHSYNVQCNDKSDIVATTKYGYEFVSIIQKDNICGVQFHPEKSHLKGMKIIENFLENF